ncbi:hypothetical protein G6F68_018667 [Rhizopus microsporus]|nr:hypothetical protein G6F68_018667 [Rhizopus microsporus]
MRCRWSSPQPALRPAPPHHAAAAGAGHRGPPGWPRCARPPARPAGPRAFRRGPFPSHCSWRSPGQPARPSGPVNGRQAASLSPHRPDRPEW